MYIHFYIIIWMWPLACHFHQWPWFTKHPEVTACMYTCSVQSKIYTNCYNYLTSTSTYVYIQIQSGESDCGIFTIAFAAALIPGHHPGKYVHFSAKSTAQALFDLSEKKSQLMIFPIKKCRHMAEKVQNCSCVLYL